jgi:hypothetical protein
VTGGAIVEARGVDKTYATGRLTVNACGVSI